MSLDLAKDTKKNKKMIFTLHLTCVSSASKKTDLSVFYTEIETKILNTDSDLKNTDRDPNIRVIAN